LIYWESIRDSHTLIYRQQPIDINVINDIWFHTCFNTYFSISLLLRKQQFRFFSTIPPKQTKRTITSYLKSQIFENIWRLKYRLWLRTDTPNVFCPLSGCEYVHVFILSFVYTCITVAIGEPVIKKGWYPLYYRFYMSPHLACLS
jgi:hypothetical protein